MGEGEGEGCEAFFCVGVTSHRGHRCSQLSIALSSTLLLYNSNNGIG